MTQRAVHALSDNELLQAIIGSGSARFPVRYIARQVQRLMKQGVPSLQLLKEVSGVGEALATRLVAVFELANRISPSACISQPIHATLPQISVEYSDVSQNVLSVGVFDRNEASALIVQRICRQALVVSASRVCIRLIYNTAPSYSVLDDLCLVRELYAALHLFEIAVGSIHRQWGTYQKELV